DNCEPRSSCHVRLLKPCCSWARSDWRRRLPTTERRMGVAKGFSGKTFLFSRILGPIPDVIYGGNRSGEAPECLYGRQAPGSPGLRPISRRTAAKAASLLRPNDRLSPRRRGRRP